MSERPSAPPLPRSEYFFERYPWNNRWFLVAIGMILSCFDFLAGPIILFPILFVVPVALLAWNCGLPTALKLGAFLAAIRFVIQYSWYGLPADMAMSSAIINAVIRLTVLFILAFLCARLSEQTQALRARVRTLEGFLPTCSFCKDIRDEEGNWHQIEEYVASHSDARFSHGVCPKCAAQHYGDILNKTKDTDKGREKLEQPAPVA